MTRDPAAEVEAHLLARYARSPCCTCGHKRVDHHGADPAWCYEDGCDCDAFTPPVG